MDVKLFEIRDKATFIPAIAIRLTADHYLLYRAGWQSLSKSSTAPLPILLAQIDSGHERMHSDVYAWASRTMQVAHSHIEENWDTLSSGQVIDVEYILGITQKPKQSEEVTTPNDLPDISGA